MKSRYPLGRKDKYSRGTGKEKKEKTENGERRGVKNADISQDLPLSTVLMTVMVESIDLRLSDLLYC